MRMELVRVYLVAIFQPTLKIAVRRKRTLANLLERYFLYVTLPLKE